MSIVWGNGGRFKIYIEIEREKDIDRKRERERKGERERERERYRCIYIYSIIFALKKRYSQVYKPYSYILCQQMLILKQMAYYDKIRIYHIISEELIARLFRYS